MAHKKLKGEIFTHSFTKKSYLRTTRTFGIIVILHKHTLNNTKLTLRRIFRLFLFLRSLNSLLNFLVDERKKNKI